MKNIITALANPILNQKLKEQNNIKLLFQDIQYQEAIFEILEIEKNIDILILSEVLPGTLEIPILIEKIKKINPMIKIILILENKKEKLENILYQKGVDKILYNSQTNIEEIIELINKDEKDIDIELKNEINMLKKIIIENNENTKKENNIKFDFIKNIFYPKKEEIKNKENKIISISGPNGVGKSIISVNIAKIMANQKNKVLIIDFDILNNSLHTILGVKKFPPKIIEKNKKDINQYIIKINKKIDLISITNILFNKENKMEIIELMNIIQNLKKQYNFIIIDTSSECFFDYTKNIIKYSDKNIFIVEANILEIKKARNLLSIYINEWKIEKEKFNILFNKYNEEAIHINLLKKIFYEFSILGVLNYEKKYNKLINKNMKNNRINKKIKKEYLEIQKKI